MGAGNRSQGAHPDRRRGGGEARVAGKLGLGLGSRKKKKRRVVEGRDSVTRVESGGESRECSSAQPRGSCSFARNNPRVSLEVWTRFRGERTQPKFGGESN